MVDETGATNVEPIQKSYFGDDFWDVGLVKGRKGETFLAEMVQRSSYMNQSRAVDYQETVVDLFWRGAERRTREPCAWRQKHPLS